MFQFLYFNLFLIFKITLINQSIFQTMFLVEDGALPHEVDQALEEFGMAMGSFRVRDISGGKILVTTLPIK